jgi:hypothetical protein
MKDQSADQLYDFVFLGTSPLVLIEATYQSAMGNSVLILESDVSMGGAWKTLNIFGYSNVENAIHYLLPNNRAIRFLIENLGLKILRTTQKYRILLIKNRFKIKFKYDILFSKAIESFLIWIFIETKLPHLINFLRYLHPASWRSRSFYVEGGAAEIVSNVKQLAKHSTISANLKIAVEKIELSENPKRVILTTNNGLYYAKKLFITHGSRIKSLVCDGNEYRPIEKKHLRPALHLCFQYDPRISVGEYIFIGDSQIKYVHDITHIASPTLPGANMRLMVLGLHPTVQYSLLTVDQIILKLKKAGLVPEDVALVEHLWQDLYLPSLDDADLFRLSSQFPDHICTLRTENFSACLGSNADRWSSILPKLTEV